MILNETLEKRFIALFIIIRFNDNQNIFYAFYWMKGNVVNMNLLKIPKIFIERLK